MKRTRKILVCLLAMIMLIGTCVTSNAATTVAAIKAISAKQENANGQMKNVSSITVYATDTVKPIEVSYTWDKASSDTIEPAGVRVTSSDRTIVKVTSSLKDVTSSTPVGSKNTVTTTGKLTITPVSSGKATISITDRVNKKKVKKINVIVKEYTEDIAFSSHVTKVEGKDTVFVANNKGKVNLGAYITNNASDKKLKYSVKEVTPAGSVSVDGKGNVTVKKAGASATVVVTSNDKKVTKEVAVNSTNPVVTSIEFVKDSTSTKDVIGLLNKKNVLTLKGNTFSDVNTYQLSCLLNEGATVKDLVFTSSNPAVAKVDNNGKITAVGNGKAVITASPKLGNAKTAKMNVKVSTDVEIIAAKEKAYSIIADGKDKVNIAAATNSDASNKTVLYEIISVTDTQDNNKVYTNADKAAIKKYVSIDKQGNVKAKKPCVAAIRAYSKENSNIERMVTVTANVPVNKIILASADGQPVVAKNKVTIYKTSATEQQNLTLIAAAAAKDAGAKPANTEVTWSSNKPAVATVNAKGEVTAVAKGTAKITATAKDGSGKKATVTVTVKTDAYEINAAKAQNVSGNDVVYVVGETTKAKKYNMASEIKAVTNSNASNKKVVYAPTSVSLKAGEEKEVQIKAADTRTYANQGAVTKTVLVKCVSKDEVAKKYDLTVNTDSVQLTAGESADIVATVIPEEGKIATDLTKLTWKSKAAGVAAIKNGKITAKKAGATTITVSYKYDGYKNEEDAKNGKITKNLTVSKTVNVFVGRKKEEIQKEVNEAFTTELKAENRDYTGISTVFDTKTNRFVMNIVKPSNDFTQLKETGLIEALESLVKYASLSYSQLTITDTASNDVWTVVRSGIKVDVLCNGVAALSGAEANEAIAYVLTNTVGEARQLKDWNGKKYNIALMVEETRSNLLSNENVETTYSYDFNYTVDVVMNDAVYKQQIDDAINTKVTTLNISGIDEITYDADKNTIIANVRDINQNIAEADKAARADVLAALEEVFADAQRTTLTVETPVGKDVVVKTRTEVNSTKEFVNSLLDEYAAKMSARVSTYGELDGSIVAANVEFKIGTMEYSQNYTLKFNVGESAFDYAADKAIAEVLEGKNFAFGKVAYAADMNNLAVEFNKEYAAKAPEELAGTGIVSVIEQMISSTAVDKEKDIVVIVGGKVSAVKASEGVMKVLSELTDGITALNQMDGKTAIVKVTYKSAVGENAKTLVYNIEFSAEKVVDASEEALIEEETTTEETVTEEETTTEEAATEEETTTEETATEEETTTEETATEEETITEEAVTEEETTEAAEETVTEEVVLEETIAE